MSSLASIKRVLAAHAPRRIIAEGMMKQAAVAAILREVREGDPDILFIQRAEHPQDPWSGHMAFPGGRVDRDDASALEAAMRETREEVALDLALFATQIGELSHLMAISHGKIQPMVILPFVFELARDLEPKLVPSDEVQEVLWVPLSFLIDQNNRSTMTWPLAGKVPITMACYRYEGRTIWGLTLAMLDELLALLLHA